MYTNFEIDYLLDQFLLNWELKQNQFQDAAEKQFFKCSIYNNQLDHLLKILLRNIYFSVCPTYLTEVLNHNIGTAQVWIYGWIFSKKNKIWFPYQWQNLERTVGSYSALECLVLSQNGNPLKGRCWTLCIYAWHTFFSIQYF